jgi:phospholipase/carboxylesterase
MLTGPELSTKSGNKPKQLILFLHGVGADGNNLIDIANVLAPHFPNAYFLSPNAPFPYDMAPSGYQWFQYRDISEENLLKGLNKAMPYLNEFVDHQLKRFNLTEQDLAVIGFSQGSMIALHTFPRRTKPIALIAGLSGTIVAPHLLEKELNSKPSILLMHGEKDQVVPVKFMKLSSQALKNLDFNIKTHIYPNLEHSINQEEIVEIIKELKEKFSK